MRAASAALFERTASRLQQPQGCITEYDGDADLGTSAAGSISTCRLKFANTRNFRGFPHVPGNDFMLRVASRRDKNDGKKLR